MFVHVCGGTCVSTHIYCELPFIKVLCCNKHLILEGSFLQCGDFNFCFIESHRLGHLVNMYFVVVIIVA